MAEAMYERSPDYFRQFQKSFRFLLFFCKPNLDKDKIANFAFAYHQKSSFCHNSSVHYHVLISSENLSSLEGTDSSKTCAIPCLFTCFKCLIYDLDGFVVHGPILEKLIDAVDYCLQQQNLHRNFFSMKKLPSICHAVKQNVQTQTDFVPLLTNQRFVEIYYNEHYAEFSKIIDIILSGYGSLNVDSETLFVKFEFEQKYKN